MSVFIWLAALFGWYADSQKRADSRAADTDSRIKILDDNLSEYCRTRDVAERERLLGMINHNERMLGYSLTKRDEAGNENT